MSLSIKIAAKLAQKQGYHPCELGVMLSFGAWGIKLNDNMVPDEDILGSKMNIDTHKHLDESITKVIHSLNACEYARIFISDVQQASKADNTKFLIGEQWFDSRILKRAYDIIGKPPYIHETGAMDCYWFLEDFKKYYLIIIEGVNGTAVIAPLQVA